MRPLFMTQTVAAIGFALDAAGARDGRIAVLDWPRLGKQLAERGRDVVQIAAKPRSLRRQSGARVYGDATALPFEDGTFAAVVVSGVSDDELAEISRVVADGGAVVMVDRAEPQAMTRMALCGGLVEIEQRTAGRTMVTSGRVAKLVAAA